MSILLLILIVLIIVALVMWGIYYVPLPPGSPAFIKPILYVIVLIIAVVVLLTHTGLLSKLP